MAAVRKAAAYQIDADTVTALYCGFILQKTKNEKTKEKLIVEKKRIHSQLFLLYRKLLSCKVKKAPRGCALRRTM